MPRKFSKEAQIAGGKIQGVKSRDSKTGIHGLSEAERRENSRKGGLVTGPILGKRNVESGQLERIRNSPEAVAGRLAWARSSENKKRCAEMGRLQGANVDWEKVRTTKSCKKGQEAGGDKSRHVRWHLNRRVFNLGCSFCLEAIARKENWGIPILDEES